MLIDSRSCRIECAIGIEGAIASSKSNRCELSEPTLVLILPADPLASTI